MTDRQTEKQEADHTTEKWVVILFALQEAIT